MVSDPEGLTPPRGAAMKTWLSWSSGKDSAWSLDVLRSGGHAEVTALFTTINAAFDRVAMHAVRRELLEAQAQAAGLVLHVIEIPQSLSECARQHEGAGSLSPGVGDKKGAARGEAAPGVDREA